MEYGKLPKAPDQIQPISEIIRLWLHCLINRHRLEIKRVAFSYKGYYLFKFCGTCADRDYEKHIEDIDAQATYEFSNPENS